MTIQPLINLQTIPGVGPNIAQHLLDIGIEQVADLKGADAEKLYAKSCHHAGVKIDRCLIRLPLRNLLRNRQAP